MEHRVATAERTESGRLLRVHDLHAVGQAVHAALHVLRGDRADVEHADLDVDGTPRAVEFERPFRVREDQLGGERRLLRAEFDVLQRDLEPGLRVQDAEQVDGSLPLAALALPRVVRVPADAGLRVEVVAPRLPVPDQVQVLVHLHEAARLANPLDIRPDRPVLRRHRERHAAARRRRAEHRERGGVVDDGDGFEGRLHLRVRRHVDAQRDDLRLARPERTDPIRVPFAIPDPLEGGRQVLRRRAVARPAVEQFARTAHGRLRAEHDLVRVPGRVETEGRRGDERVQALRVVPHAVGRVRRRALVPPPASVPTGLALPFVRVRGERRPGHDHGRQRGGKPLHRHHVPGFHLRNLTP